ncbi:hypothetical protein [Natronospora cellulosivora (SeqCode)]
MHYEIKAAVSEEVLEEALEESHRLEVVLYRQQVMYLVKEIVK